MSGAAGAGGGRARRRDGLRLRLRDGRTFLRRRRGPAHGMHDEAEVMGESHERVIARMGQKEKARRVDRDTATANLEDAIRRLEKTATVSERGQLQRLKVQLAKLTHGSVRDAA